MKMLIKILGVLVITVSISLFGFLKSYWERSYISLLGKIAKALASVDAALRLTADCRERILSSSFDGVDGFCMHNGDAHFINKNISDTLCSEINTFFRDFGSGDIILERQRIKRVSGVIKTAIEKEQKEYAATHKLWQTVGVCAGLMLGIMLI